MGQPPHRDSAELDEYGHRAQFAEQGVGMLSTLRHAGLRLALAAMLLRALVPDGWMPNTTGSQGAPFAICTVNGPVVLGAAPDLSGRHAPTDTRHMDVCPFAAAPHSAVFAPLVAPSLPSQIAYAIPFLSVGPAVAAARPHGPQTPRGPPIVV